MKRWLGRFWLLAKIAAVVALLVLVAWAWVLPWLVEQRIEQRLRSAGAGEAAVSVHRVGWGAVELGSLTIGTEERLAVDAARVSYKLADLRRGRVGTLTLSGAQLVLTLNDAGQLELGDLTDLLDGEGADDWLFEKIELHHSAVLVETPTAVVRVPVQGLITAHERRLTLGLRAEGIAQRARLSGRVDRTADGLATDNLRLMVEGGDGVIGDWAIRNWRAELRLHGLADARQLRLEIQPGSRFEAERISGLEAAGTVRATLADGSIVATLDAPSDTAAAAERGGAEAADAPRALVEAARQTLGQSVFRLRPFRLDMGDAAIEAGIGVERLSLDTWLSLMGADGLSGTGDLAGELRLTARPGDSSQPITWGDGSLEATANGRLRVDDRSVIANLPEEVRPDEGADAERDAARFDYTALRFDLLRQEQDVALRIELAGNVIDDGRSMALAPLVLRVDDFGTLVNATLTGDEGQQ